MSNDVNPKSPPAPLVELLQEEKPKDLGSEAPICTESHPSRRELSR